MFKLFKAFFLPTLLLICLGCKDKQTNTQEVVKNDSNKVELQEKSTKIDKKTILCFGNSLTAGYGLDEKEAWPSLLQEKLDSLQFDYNVINAGLSGETSSGGLNRIDWVINQQVDIFILELGANDMLRGIDYKNTAENLGKILKKVKEKNESTKILIAGILSPPNMGKKYETNFNNIFKDLQKEFETSLVPFFLDKVAGIEKLNLPDGKHPNAKGQKIVLENIWTHLNPML